MDNSVNFVMSESIHDIEFPGDNVEAEYGHPRSMGSVPVQIDVNQVRYNNIPVPSTDHLATVQIEVNQVRYNNIPTEGDGNQPADIPGSNIPAPSTDHIATVVEQLIAIGQSQTTEYDGNQPADIPGNQSSTSDNEDVPESLKQRIICDQCGKTLYSKSGFKTHIDAVHKGYKCVCKICGASMKYPSNLTIHMRVIHKMGEPPSKKNINRVCPKCSKKFSSNFLMFHHLKTVHKVAKPYECSLCHKFFRTITELSIHKVTHPELAPYACNICSQRYKSKINLEKHREKNGHYETAESVPYSKIRNQCQKCKKVFTSNHSYKTHVTNLDGTCSRDDDRDICKCCGKVFENKLDLKDHFISEHKEFRIGEVSKTGETTLPTKKPCPVCNKLLYQNGIYYHAKLHAGVKPHKCDQCDYRAILAPDIAKHKRYVHNKERLFSCRFCCRKFISRREEKGHKDFHFGIKRFECKVCQKKYTNKRQCKLHEKLCKIGKAFTQGINPKDVVAFRCKWCGGMYSISSAYTRHAKTCELKGGTEYEVRKKEDLEKAFDEMQQKADKQEREKQKLDKQECDKQEHDKQEHDKQEQRPDFLPWCKICSGIFKDSRSFKHHNNCCRVGSTKERAKMWLGTEESSSDDDDELTEKKPRTINILKTPKPNRVSNKKEKAKKRLGTEESSSDDDNYGDDNDDEDGEITEKKPITIKVVKPSKPKLRTSPRKRKRNEQNQRDLHVATDEIFSPFSFSCEVCGKETEELVKEFCPEHYTFCSFCDKSLKYDENLKMHLKEHLEKHEETEIPEALVCKTCRKTTEELVDAHISKHPYHCLKCKLTFTAENQLRLHNREHRIQVVYRCEQCTETFTNKVKFTRHLNEHVKQQQLRPITRTQILRSTLIMPSESDRRILALGHNTQPLVEQDLDAVSVDFSSPSQIINNVQTSILPSGTAPEGSTPSTSNAETNLQKTPSGVLFQCPHCQKIFSIERNLHVHMRSEMPFPCSFCILSYKTKFGYDMHLKDKHLDIWKMMYM